MDYNINIHSFAKDVYEAFFSSEDSRKLFRKLLMKYIDMPNKYKRYTMDIYFEPGSNNTVPTYTLALRKNCKSMYRKNLVIINRNSLRNVGIKEWGNTNGIAVDYDLVEFSKLFLREHKILSVLYGN